MTTPVSSSGVEAVDNLVTEINARYGTILPIRGPTWSPSKARGSNKLGNEVVDRIRFLYYKDNALLQKILDDFDKKADLIHTEWKFKPRAEEDVIPRHETSRSTLGPRWTGSLSTPPRAVIEQLSLTLAHSLDTGFDRFGISKDVNCLSQSTCLNVEVSLESLILR